MRRLDAEKRLDSHRVREQNNNNASG